MHAGPWYQHFHWIRIQPVGDDSVDVQKPKQSQSASNPGKTLNYSASWFNPAAGS